MWQVELVELWSHFYAQTFENEPKMHPFTHHEIDPQKCVPARLNSWLRSPCAPRLVRQSLQSAKWSHGGWSAQGRTKGADVLSTICKLLRCYTSQPWQHHSSPLGFPSGTSGDGIRAAGKIHRDPPKAPPLKLIKNWLAKSQTKPKKLSCSVLSNRPNKTNLFKWGLLRDGCLCAIYTGGRANKV